MLKVSTLNTFLFRLFARNEPLVNKIFTFADNGVGFLLQTFWQSANLMSSFQTQKASTYIVAHSNHRLFGCFDVVFNPWDDLIHVDYNLMARSIYSYVHIWICPHFSDFHCIMTVLLHHARAGGCKVSYVVLLRVHYKE